MIVIWEISCDVYLDETGEGKPISEMEIVSEQVPTDLRNQIDQFLRKKALAGE